MKKALTLLAMTSALLPLYPLVSRAEAQHYVQGINWAEGSIGNWSTATGWYDANKSWEGDGLLCWAATCSNMIAWWQEQNGYENVNLTGIWDEYRATFVNGSGVISAGLIWWFDGSGIGTEEYELHLKTGVTNPGGHYNQNLSGGRLETTGALGSQNVVTVSTNKYGNATTFSQMVTSYIDKGYAVGANFTTGSSGHAETIWGVGCDANGLITTLYLADSDDVSRGQPDVANIRVEPVTIKNVDNKQVLALTYSPDWYLESVHLLSPSLSNDINSFNTYSEETQTVTMKQDTANGRGYIMWEEHPDVQNIVFDGSQGAQKRTLTVEGEHTAESVSLASSGTNVINVTEGSSLAIEQVSGAGKLTKTGSGTLKIGDRTSACNLDVLGGNVVNDGSLGEVTMSNGGYLVQQGTATATSLTIGDGCTAEVDHVFGNKAFEKATVNDGGTLKGSGKLGKVLVNEGGTLVVGNSPGTQSYQSGQYSGLELYKADLVFSIDDAAVGWRDYAKDDTEGWGSGKYSTINMNEQSLTLVNPGFVFELGGNILERSANTNDLESALGRTFSVTLTDLKLIYGVSSMALSDLDSVYGDLSTYADRTTFILSEDDPALIAKNLTADIGVESLKYEISGTDLYMTARLNVTLAAAPEVPEPATGSLSLLALAGLCARRRKK